MGLSLPCLSAHSTPRLCLTLPCLNTRSTPRNPPPKLQRPHIAPPPHCPGLNDKGQVGDGTTTTSTAPVAVGDDRWATVSASEGFTCGIKQADRSMFCWGECLGLGMGSYTGIPECNAPHAFSHLTTYVCAPKSGLLAVPTLYLHLQG